jgi:DNA repair exonuclease SbcCD ATPase subunit
MPSEDHRSASDALTELDALVAAAKSFREHKPSRFENLFHPNRHARREAKFAAAVLPVVKAIRDSLKETSARLARLEEDERLSKFEANLEELRRGLEQLRRERDDSIKDAHDRAVELREQIDRFAREQDKKLETLAREQEQQRENLSRAQGERIEQLNAGQADLGREIRERIQHVLDEQRVAIRQLSLKASEDAVLSDRARRAAEAKLEELAKRIPPAQA